MNKKMDLADEIMTVREAADYLRLQPRTIYYMVSSGKLKAFKIMGEGKWLLKREDIEAAFVSNVKPRPYKERKRAKK